MFRASPRPSSGAYNCINSLWFYRWSVGGSSVVGHNRPDHDQQPCYHHAPTVKPEAANAVVSSWWWAWRRPETCWTTHKRQVINLWNCCIWLVNLFELCDDAWTCQHQIYRMYWDCESVLLLLLLKLGIGSWECRGAEEGSSPSNVS